MSIKRFQWMIPPSIIFLFFVSCAGIPTSKKVVPIPVSQQIPSLVEVSQAQIPYAETPAIPEIHARLGGIPMGIGPFVFSQDGKTALSGSNRGVMVLWDVATGRELKTIIVPKTMPRSIALSPSGTMAVVGMYNNVVIWDILAGKPIREIPGNNKSKESQIQGGVNFVEFTADSKKILVGCQYPGSLRLFEISTGALIRTFPMEKGLLCSVAFSPDGQRFASGDNHGLIQYWDMSTGKKIASFGGMQRATTALAFSRDGGTLIASSSWLMENRKEKYALVFWNIKSNNIIKIIDNNHSEANAIFLSKDGNTMYSASSDKTIRSWDMKSGKALGEISTEFIWNDGKYNPPSGVSFSPDGSTVICWDWRSDMLPTVGKIKAIDILSGKEIVFFYKDPGHFAPVNSIAVSPDGRTAFSSSYDNKDAAIRKWDILDGRLLDISYEQTSAIAISRDGMMLLAGNEDGTVNLVDLTGVKPSMIYKGHTGKVNSVAFSPNSLSFISGGNDGTIRLMDILGNETKTFVNMHPSKRKESSFVTIVAFSPDGTKALYGRGDDSLVIWDPVTFAILWVFSAKNVLRPAPNRGFVASFSPDGKTILAGNGRMLWLFDSLTGKVLFSREGHSDWITSVAFSPDGKTALSASADSTLKLWKFPYGNEVKTFLGHLGEVSSVSFLADAKTALSGGNDGTIRYWDLDSGNWRYFAIAEPIAIDNNFVVLTPEGFYSGNEQTIRRYLYMIRGRDLIDINLVYSLFYRPDLVAAKAKGENITSDLEKIVQDDLPSVLDPFPANP